LYLISSTVSDTVLKGYYTDPSYKTYLDNAVDGLEPFAYISGNGSAIPVLLDAAQHDLASNSVPMIIPGDYPLGIYTIAGELTGTDGSKSSVVFKLIIENSTNTLTDVNVQPDLTLIPNPNPLSFGTLKPGNSAVKPVTLTSGNSKLSVTVSIIGDALMQSILSDEQTVGTFLAYKGDSFTISNNTVKTFNAKLIVPTGTSSKTYTGTIVYTVLEDVTS
jgi:hypothetical protein